MKTTATAVLIIALMFSSCRNKYNLATVRIEKIENITHTSAIVKCNATADGGIFIVEKGVCWSEKSPATISDNCYDRGVQDVGEYTSPLYNLKAGTVYYVRAYAKNLEGIAYSEEKQIKTKIPDYLTDTRDDQKYAIVKIGNQYWMAENLKYYTSNGSWYYNNDSIQFSKYGRLYNWQIACNVCPDGWRLPNRDDWNELLNFINNSSESNSVCEGNKAYRLKMPGTEMWEYEKDSINNETGFSAIGAGVYDNNTLSFYKNKINAVFWSFNEYDANNAWFYRIEAYSNAICTNFGDKSSGLSVRCLKTQ